MFYPYTYRWGDEIPKRGETSLAGTEPRFGSKGCIVNAILNEGERFFQGTAYIYIWKADKDVAEIKFCYPMFACEGKR